MDLGNILENALTAAFGSSAMIYAIAAIGLNVHFGYTGLLNFGQAGFMAMGAYGVGVGVLTFGWPLWGGVLLGIGASVVFALILGIPTLRLRADYLAIATIAASEIIRYVVSSTTTRSWSGGSNGLNGFSSSFQDLNPLSPGSYGIGPIQYRHPEAWALIVGWGLAALITVMLWLLMRSPWGRVLRAIREDEDAVRSLGKNVYWFKMQSLILGGVIGSIGGMMFALSRGSVQPANYGTALTFFVLTALILGGAARLASPIVGACLFWALLSLSEGLIRGAQTEGWIPESIMDGVQVGQVRFMLVGIGLAILMLVRPQGIFGDRREIALDDR